MFTFWVFTHPPFCIIPLWGIAHLSASGCGGWVFPCSPGRLLSWNTQNCARNCCSPWDCMTPMWAAGTNSVILITKTMMTVVLENWEMLSWEWKTEGSWRRGTSPCTAFRGYELKSLMQRDRSGLWLITATEFVSWKRTLGPFSQTALLVCNRRAVDWPAAPGCETDMSLDSEGRDHVHWAEQATSEPLGHWSPFFMEKGKRADGLWARLPCSLCDSSPCIIWMCSHQANKRQIPLKGNTWGCLSFTLSTTLLSKSWATSSELRDSWKMMNGLGNNRHEEGGGSCDRAQCISLLWLWKQTSN